jgi:hypothetical protein
MARWTDITAKDENGLSFPVTYKDAAGTKSSGKFKVKAQYDKDRTTPVETYVRFVPVAVDGELPQTTDGFYILSNANNYADAANAGRKLLTLKEADKDWRSATEDFKISKAYNGETFCIQDYWICNTGQGTVNVDKQTIKYASGTKTFYNWFKATGDRDGENFAQSSGDRKNYVSKHKSYYLKLASYIGSATKTSCSVTDNKDNTVTITWKLSLGDAEVLKNVQLRWGTTSSCTEVHTIKPDTWPTAGNTKTWTITKNINITKPSDATQQIYAKVTAGTTYYLDSGREATANAAIKQYVAPPAVQRTEVGAEAEVKLKDIRWLNWWRINGTNKSSPTKGYRLKVYKNGTAISGLVLADIDNSKIRELERATEMNPDTYIDHIDLLYDVNAGVESDIVKFYPNKLGFKVGDKLTLGIQAYSLDGKGTKLLSAETRSSTLTIKNSAVVQVKTAAGWKEGQVYVKVNGAWKEAQGVYTRATTWKEST